VVKDNQPNQLSSFPLVNVIFLPFTFYIFTLNNTNPLNLLQRIRNYFSPVPQPPPGPPNPVSGNILNLPQDKQYRVIKEFTDYDRIIHPIGETWIYRGTNFLPYEDGVSVFITVDDHLYNFRLQWRTEEQADIIDNFPSFVEPSWSR
jgi:hypothetical protein